MIFSPITIWLSHVSCSFPWFDLYRATIDAYSYACMNSRTSDCLVEIQCWRVQACASVYNETVGDRQLCQSRPVHGVSEDFVSRWDSSMYSCKKRISVALYVHYWWNGWTNAKVTLGVKCKVDLQVGWSCCCKMLLLKLCWLTRSSISRQPCLLSAKQHWHIGRCLRCSTLKQTFRERCQTARYYGSHTAHEMLAWLISLVSMRWCVKV